MRFNYQLNRVQKKQLESLLSIVSGCKKEGIKVWVFGGYGLDALYGKLTRDHADFDLHIRKKSEKKFTKIIQKLGYVRTDEKVGEVGKVVFRNFNLRPEFRLELGIIEKGEKLARKLGVNDISKGFPDKTLGKLCGQSIHTPTLLGFKKVIEVNDKLAEKNGWDKYPHRKWQRNILTAIEAKNREEERNA